MSCETHNFSLSLWLKFLLSLLPFPWFNYPPPGSKLSLALVDMMDALLASFVEVLPRIRNVWIPPYYQVEYESDEETIDAGTDHYEAMLRNAQSKVSLYGLNCVVLSERQFSSCFFQLRTF